jgi:hypothetical protein
MTFTRRDLAYTSNAIDRGLTVLGALTAYRMYFDKSSSVRILLSRCRT